MKLCATVLAVHHRPIAISGGDGTVRRSAPYAPASATRIASRRECRSTLIRSLLARCMNCFQVACEHIAFDGPGIGTVPNFDHADAERVRVRSRGFFLRRADAPDSFETSAKPNRRAGFREAQKVRPFGARRALVPRIDYVIKVPALRGLVVRTGSAIGKGERAPDLNRGRRVCTRFDDYPIDNGVNADRIATWDRCREGGCKRHDCE